MTYAPRTVYGTLDRRYAANKPKVCRYCQATGLFWRKSTDTGKWAFFDAYGQQHTCEAYRNRDNTPTPPPATAPVVDNSSLSAMLKAEADQHLAEILATAVKRLNEVGETEAGNVVDATEGIAEATARKIIAELVPVEHRIVIENANGAVNTIEGRPHMTFETLLQLCNLRDEKGQHIHTMLIGPAGSGKTTAAHLAAEALGLRFFERSMGLATSEWDLLGYRSPDGVYIPGLLREPYENGGLLMLDEIDNSNPSVLTTLNSALENGQCTFPDGAVKRHPDFICIAGGNTYGTGPDRMYVGRTQLDAATLDRFANLDWDYDEEAEIDWVGRDMIAWTRYVQAVRKAAMDNSMRVVVGPRASIKGAVALRAGMDSAIVVKAFLWKGMSGDDRSRLEYIVGPYSA